MNINEIETKTARHKRQRRHRKLNRILLLTPRQQEREIESDKVRRELGEPDFNFLKRTLSRARRQLLNDVPSSTWFDAIWEGERHINSTHEVRYVCERQPEGWVRCQICNRLAPPIDVSSRGACYDCVVGDMSKYELASLPVSPSAKAIEAMMYYKKRFRV